jgi:hypothetical protein
MPPQQQYGMSNQPPFARQPLLKLTVLGLVLAVFLPPIGFIVSLIALKKVKKTQHRGQDLALTGVIIGSVFSGLMIVGFSLPLLANGPLKNTFFGANQAQLRLKPLLSDLRKDGGKEICSNGDSGHGLDNTIPWHEAYYELSDSQARANLQAAAQRDGFELTTDSNPPLMYGADPNPQATYMKAKDQKGATLDITIVHEGSIILDCNSSSSVPYGTQRSTNGSTDLVDLSMTLPDTQQ